MMWVFCLISAASTHVKIGVLIPKGGEKKLLKNWRPISLLNYDYKIITKVLTSRLTRRLGTYYPKLFILTKNVA